MNLKARCRTTAMGIMPHTDIDRALELSMSLDIPFWPQLPKTSYYQDMYAQTAQHFPGIVAEIENRRLTFSPIRFEQELWDYSEKMERPETFSPGQEYAAIYDRFLGMELQGYHAIRGQVAGPISLGFNVMDEDRRPIIYNDEVKALLFDFVQRKANAQYRQLKEKNPDAFVWLDEPGLSYIFSSLYGYTDHQAWEDYQPLLQGMEGAKGLHLCTNVNLPYLLELGIEIISLDAYQLGAMPVEYAKAASEFIRGGGIICWGIVPTQSTVLAQETPETLSDLLLDYWGAISQHGDLSLGQIAEQALLAPARCCIKELGLDYAADYEERRKDPDKPSIEETAVNKAFAYLGLTSRILRDRCQI